MRQCSGQHGLLLSGQRDHQVLLWLNMLCWHGASMKKGGRLLVCSMQQGEAFSLAIPDACVYECDFSCSGTIEAYD